MCYINSLVLQLKKNTIKNIARIVNTDRLFLQETISRSTGTKHTLLTNHSHDSGYADSHAQASPNGWISSTSAANNSQIPPRGELQAQQQSVDQPGPAFAYQQTSSRVSSNGSQSLSGSSDSLLSDGSSSGQSQNGYLRQRSSQPALPPKESRNSRSSVRTTSTGNFAILLKVLDELGNRC